MSAKNCVTHHHACDCREAWFEDQQRQRNTEISKLHSQLEELRSSLTAAHRQNEVMREALDVIVYTDRSRGYPTGIEWMEIVKITKAALDSVKGVK